MATRGRDAGDPRSPPSLFCGFCLCTFDHEHGQTVAWAFDPASVLSRRDASTIAVNSFPDNTRGGPTRERGRLPAERSDGAKDTVAGGSAGSCVERVGGQIETAGGRGARRTTSVVYCFRQRKVDRESGEGDLSTPFVPLHGAKGGVVESVRETDQWIHCYVHHEVSLRDDLSRGAEQRSFVVFSSSPEAAIFETAARELVRQGIIDAVQAPPCSSPKARTADDHGALRWSAPPLELGALVGRMLSPLSSSTALALKPSLSLQPLPWRSSERGAPAAETDADAPAIDGDDGRSASHLAAATAGTILLERIPPTGGGGWDAITGAVGPVARLCAASDVAAGAGTRLFRRGGLYQALRGVDGSLVPKLWLLWELVLVGEPLIVLSPSPDVSAAAVTALAGLLHPLPNLCDYRPYITIQDPIHHSLAMKKIACDGFILGVTNTMILQTLPIANVLSLSASAEGDGVGDGEVEPRWGLGTGQGGVECATSSPTATAPPPGNSTGAATRTPPPSPRSRAGGGPVREGLRTKLRGSVRPCARTIGMLISADAMRSPSTGPTASGGDAFRAACLANDSILSSYFSSLTTRFLEPLRKFTAPMLVKLVRSQPFSAFPSMMPLSAEDAASELERERRTVAGALLAMGGTLSGAGTGAAGPTSEFPVSLYRRFLLSTGGRRWFNATRLREWEQALRRWSENASTRQCFAKLREIDEVSRAGILSNLQSEVVDKLDSKLIVEKAALDVCRLCTQEVCGA